MTWPQPTRKDHDAFCSTEGGRRVRDARGRTGTHHVTYEFDLPDGRILRTRVSHPVNRTDYGPSVWRRVLRDQLAVAESEFWGCVRDGVKPHRGLPADQPAAPPAEFAHLLIARVGLDEAEVAQMSKDDAVARLQCYWVEGS